MWSEMAFEEVTFETNPEWWQAMQRSQQREFQPQACQVQRSWGGNMLELFKGEKAATTIGEINDEIREGGKHQIV